MNSNDLVITEVDSSEVKRRDNGTGSAEQFDRIMLAAIKLQKGKSIKIECKTEENAAKVRVGISNRISRGGYLNLSSVKRGTAVYVVQKED